MQAQYLSQLEVRGERWQDQVWLTTCTGEGSNLPTRQDMRNRPHSPGCPEPGQRLPGAGPGLCTNTLISLGLQPLVPYQSYRSDFLVQIFVLIFPGREVFNTEYITPTKTRN